MTAGARVGAPLGVVALVGLVLFATADTAGAQETGWLIERFDVDIAVEPDGTLDVTERIDVDFGSLDKHGIFRDIPVRYDLGGERQEVGLPPDEDPRDWFRAIDVSGIQVTSTAPDDVEISRPGRTGGDRDLRIRIGDPDRTVSGPQSYTISYRVRGATNAFSTHEELYWNATGDGWGVPMQRAEVTVSGAPVVRHTCFQGPSGSTRLCDQQSASGSQASFGARGLAPFSGLTVVVGFDPDVVEAGPPLLHRRWTLSQAFVGSPWAVPLAVLAGLAGLAGVAWLAFRQGRDRVTRGAVSAAGVVEEPVRRGLLSPRAVPVRFRPPDGLRPAQLGLIVDERIDPVDISATIVDLAARGHLTIEEVEEDLPLWFTRTDWRLRRASEPPKDDDLLGYERTLLDGLFGDGDTVVLSDLKGSFAGDYQKVKRNVYADGVRRRWFNRSPDRTRTRWLGVGGAAVAAAVALTVVLAVYTRVAIAGVALLVPALVLLLAHRWMPHRTARGSKVLDETLGFREFIVTAEADRMSFAEDERMFVDYLPYAVVFGAVDHWAEVLADLGIEPTEVGWYVGADHRYGFASLSSGLSSFATTVGPSLATTPASSGSSGFSGGGGSSGGGFGGGGGGSW